MDLVEYFYTIIQQTSASHPYVFTLVLMFSSGSLILLLFGKEKHDVHVFMIMLEHVELIALTLKGLIVYEHNYMNHKPHHLSDINCSS